MRLQRIVEILPHVVKAGVAEVPDCATQVEDMDEMSIEVEADYAKKPTLVGVADVEKVIKTSELCKDAAGEPVIVEAEDAKEPREAAQTAVRDILALEFQSPEVKFSENAEELNCAEQVTIEDILEMSKEVKAEYAEEPEGCKRKHS
jgi:hypothetical protein